MGRTAGSLPHRKPNKKEPVGFFKRGGRREYFAQIGACGLPNVALRSCHCCAMGRTTGSLPHRKPNKKEPVGFFKRGGRREYFAQIGACGLPNVALRSCHCCAMGRTTGSLPHRKPNKKEPVGSFLFGTPAGNRTRNGPLGVAAFVSKLRK